MGPTAIATIVLVSLGAVSALILIIGSRLFFVKEDPRIEAVAEALLGANCGGCGYAGCSAAAEAVVKGQAGVDVCVAGGYQCAVNAAAVMGVEISETEPLISLPGCRYNVENADSKFEYNGFKNCQAAMMLYGGTKECNIGCLGLGSCAAACSFGAITMVDGLPVVDSEKCTGCGVCEKTCPKGIITLSNHTTRMTSEYTADECTAPCQRTCPAGIDIPKYIKCIAEQHYEDAVRIMREKNALLSVCGRICPAPCETQCRRNLVDQPVAINMLKKFVTDYEWKNGKRVEEFIARSTGKKVAVVGGGAEGLSASYFLARLGHAPEIFEVNPKLGGILRYVITKDRLPDDILDWEIEGILKTGVKANTGVLVGKDFTINSLLKQGNDAVLMTSGGMDSRKLIRGSSAKEQSIPGLYLLFDFLTSGTQAKETIKDKAVCIVGDSKHTFAAAKVCMDTGAKSVSVITRLDCTPEDLPENITAYTNSLPSRISGVEERLSTISIETNGEASDIPADVVILDAGRIPELVFIAEKENDRMTGWTTADTYKGFSKIRKDGLFSTVEPGRISDYTATVKAVGAGRKIAGRLHHFMMDGHALPPLNPVTETSDIQNVSELENVDSVLRHLPENVSDSGLVISELPVTDQGFSEKTALAEAARCMNCGLICYSGEYVKS